jgi:hypothetical protein
MRPPTNSIGTHRSDEDSRQERGARGQVRDEDGFVEGMGAFADCAHAVEGGNADKLALSTAESTSRTFCGNAIIRLMGDKQAEKEMEMRALRKQAAELLKRSDTDVHIAKNTMTTLCGKPIPPARCSPRQSEVTCQRCKGESNWTGL